jgi:hypothetical protein
MAGKFYRSVRAGEDCPIRIQDIRRQFADDVFVAENLIATGPEHDIPGPAVLISEAPDPEGYSDKRGLIKERGVAIHER